MHTISTPAPSALPRPFLRRALDVFVSPGELFEEFRGHAPWKGVLALAAVIAAATVLLTPAELFLEEIRRSSQGQPLPAGAEFDAMMRFAPIFGAVGVLFSVPLTAALTAGVMLVVFSLFLGGDARYRQYLAVTAHATLIVALGGLLTLPLQIARADLTARLSLSLLTPFLDPDGLAFRILDQIDVFTLWALVVAGLGAHVLNRRPSWAAAAGTLLGAYLLIVSTITWVTG